MAHRRRQIRRAVGAQQQQPRREVRRAIERARKQAERFDDLNAPSSNQPHAISRTPEATS